MPRQAAPGWVVQVVAAVVRVVALLVLAAAPKVVVEVD
jgi:hypothetical protein